MYYVNTRLSTKGFFFLTVLSTELEGNLGGAA